MRRIVGHRNVRGRDVDRHTGRRNASGTADQKAFRTERAEATGVEIERAGRASTSRVVDDDIAGAGDIHQPAEAARRRAHQRLAPDVHRPRRHQDQLAGIDRQTWHSRVMGERAFAQGGVRRIDVVLRPRVHHGTGRDLEQSRQRVLANSPAHCRGCPTPCWTRPAATD